jgi:hypothetical protein
MEQQTQPVQTFRYGKIKAAIWANETEHGIMYKVTFLRSYKDGDQWKNAISFGRDDLPLVAKLANKAHSWIYEQS